MKNLKYFPFERSRYFYGKLLTVDDFETEQKYANDKRRLINRFLHGSGVVCGMNVVRVDDRTISVERGMALDFAGVYKTDGITGSSPIGYGMVSASQTCAL